jgi:SAM-dependent methyltransferase
LVEVGCSAGAALAAAVERGWKVEGIEPSPEAAEVARRRPGVRAVHTGSLLDAAIPPNSVDVMLFFDVIEHIDPPEPTLRAVHRCLSPGGLVLMVTPDAGSLSARWMGRRWPHLFVEHVVIYGRAALAQALEQVGLTVERVAFAWKRVNLNMLVRHATIHRHVRFGALLRVLGHLVPRPLQNLTFPFNMGEFYIIARRGEPRAAGRDTERPA